MLYDVSRKAVPNFVRAVRLIYTKMDKMNRLWVFGIESRENATYLIYYVHNDATLSLAQINL